MTLSDFLKKEENASATHIEIIPEGCTCGFFGDIEKIPQQILSREVVDCTPPYYAGLLTVYIANEE